MRVLVLGHTGMLGNAVHRYFQNQSAVQVSTITARYPDSAFLPDIKATESEYIINCIGAIPQHTPNDDTYRLLNEELPQRLDTLGVPVLHPSTDCEFAGTLPIGEQYRKDHERDAADAYGRSKAHVSAWIEQSAKHTKVIRTSIIGHEISSNRSLLSWFLAQTEPVRGYSNHYWNGITTLEWAKQAFTLMTQWADAPVLTQLATEPCVSKYELLCLMRNAYEKNIVIKPYETEPGTNKCLLSDIVLSPLAQQLTELRSFYAE